GRRRWMAGVAAAWAADRPRRRPRVPPLARPPAPRRGVTSPPAAGAPAGGAASGRFAPPAAVSPLRPRRSGPGHGVLRARRPAGPRPRPAIRHPATARTIGPGTARTTGGLVRRARSGGPRTARASGGRGTRPGG